MEDVDRSGVVIIRRQVQPARAVCETTPSAWWDEVEVLGLVVLTHRNCEWKCASVAANLAAEWRLVFQRVGQQCEMTRLLWSVTKPEGAESIVVSTSLLEAAKTHR